MIESEYETSQSQVLANVNGELYSFTCVKNTQFIIITTPNGDYIKNFTFTIDAQNYCFGIGHAVFGADGKIWFVARSNIYRNFICKLDYKDEKASCTQFSSDMYLYLLNLLFYQLILFDWWLQAI